LCSGLDQRRRSCCTPTGPARHAPAASSSPLQTAAAFALVSADLQAGLETLWAELQRHVAGQLHDDVALLLIEHSR
jgi:hypothetical protein